MKNCPKKRLISALLVVGLAPFAIVAMISLQQAGAASEQQASAHFDAVRGLKKSQIERFFIEREVTSNITCVTHAAEDAGTASSQVLEVATGLTSQAGELQAEVGRFIVRVRGD